MTNNNNTAERPTAAELRGLVRQEPRTPGRKEAIAGLLELKPRGLNRYLKELALDDTLDEPTRLDAVTALGREATPTALEGLRSALEVDDQTVRRRAIREVGTVGTADDLAKLKEIRTGNPVTQRMLRSAKVMLSYRHGLGEYHLDVPSRVYGATDGEGIDIAVSRLTPKVVDELAPAVVAPGVNLTWEGARRLQCGSNDYVFAVTKGHSGKSMAALTEQQSLPAVLLAYNDETGQYAPGYYFATDPVSKGRFHIHGIRGSGRPALYGTGNLEDGVVNFEVRAIETPYEPPVTVTGSYTLKSGAIDFEVAMSDPRLAARQQRLRKAPRAQEGPVR